MRACNMLECVAAALLYNAALEAFVAVVVLVHFAGNLGSFDKDTWLFPLRSISGFRCP